MKKTITKIIERLQGGHVGVIASDTLFGLVGKAFDRDAVEKIYTIKKRSAKKPCIILINDISQLDDFHVILNDRFRAFFHKIWPGPVTVILRLEDQYLDQYEYLHRGTGELTFRLPDNNRLHQVIDGVGPIIAPSANPEGKTPAQSIDDIKKYFGDRVDVYVDPKDVPYTGQPSTIIKIKDHTINLIRAGVVPFEDITSIWTSLL
jgi:L-threonylcarbamoyladenylate synthase